MGSAWEEVWPGAPERLAIHQTRRGPWEDFRCFRHCGGPNGVPATEDKDKNPGLVCSGAQRGRVLVRHLRAERYGLSPSVLAGRFPP